jgi:hypothetical protein
MMLSGCKAAWMKRLGCFADQTQKNAIKASMTSPTKRQSLQSYLDDLRSAHASLEAFAFEICLDTREGNALAEHQEANRARYQLASEFPENFCKP